MRNSSSLVAAAPGEHGSVEEVDELVAAAESALDESERNTTVSVEQEAAAMAAVRTQIEEHGVSEKTHGKHGLAGSMRRKFERFLEKHAVRLGAIIMA